MLQILGLEPQKDPWAEFLELMSAGSPSDWLSSSTPSPTWVHMPNKANTQVPSGWGQLSVSDLLQG